MTPAGEAFLDVARRMLRQVDEGTDAARRAEAGETGSLAVGVNTSVAALVLSKLLRHWNRRRPAVRTRLISGSARELVDLVRRRELDLALVDGPVADAGLDSALVVDDYLVVMLPADHPLAGHDAVPVRSLHGEQFVAVARRSSVSLHDRYDALRRERLPAALLQGLRDRFGSHTYRRVDREGVFHTWWSGDRRKKRSEAKVHELGFIGRWARRELGLCGDGLMPALAGPAAR